MRRAILIPLVLLCCFGCSELESVESEPKRADDRINPAELESFLTIIDSLPDRRLPSLPPVMPNASQWGRSRTLPVNELVKEEERSLAGRISIERFAGHFPQSRFLKRALRREKITIEQFVGLYLALGLSVSRTHVPADRDLDQIVARGKRAIIELKKDQRLFSSLPDDEGYFLKEQSGWLAVVDRATHLRQVHHANVDLVQRHRARLEGVLPAEFSQNPFLEFGTILDDRGIPFQEPPGQESDDHISWSRDQAFVGTDPAAADEGQ